MQENKHKISVIEPKYEINARIREFCTSQRIIQADLERLGINKSTVHMVWKDKQLPSVEFIQKMAVKFCNLNLEWLLKGEGQMFSDKEDGTAKTYTDDKVKMAVQKIVLQKEREIGKISSKLSEVQEKYIKLLEKEINK